MIESNELSCAWKDIKEKLKKGDLVSGIVMSHYPFGIFLDLGIQFYGLVQIVNFKDGNEIMSPLEYPQIGKIIEAAIIDFNDSNMQILLSLKPTDLKNSLSDLTNNRKIK